MKTSLLRLGLAGLLVAVLALSPAGTGIAAAGGDPPAGDAPGTAWQAGVEWIAGLLGNLLDPWVGGTENDRPHQPLPQDRDGVRDPVGSGIDPSGITGNGRPHTPPPPKDH